MVAMILIIGIFVVGKMLGYGSAKNLYLLEGYKDVLEASGNDNGEDIDDLEPMKNKKETYDTQKSLTPKELSDEDEEGEEGEEVTTEGKEEFTCGAKSGIPAYDKDDVYAPF